MAAKMHGEISARRAAKILGRDERTVQRWCDKTVRGEPSPLQYARKRVGLRPDYYVQESEIRALVDS